MVNWFQPLFLLTIASAARRRRPTNPAGEAPSLENRPRWRAAQPRPLDAGLARTSILRRHGTYSVLENLVNFLCMISFNVKAKIHRF